MFRRHRVDIASSRNNIQDRILEIQDSRCLIVGNMQENHVTSTVLSFETISYHLSLTKWLIFCPWVIARMILHVLQRTRCNQIGNYIDSVIFIPLLPSPGSVRCSDRDKLVHKPAIKSACDIVIKLKATFDISWCNDEPADKKRMKVQMKRVILMVLWFSGWRRSSKCRGYVMLINLRSYLIKSHSKLLLAFPLRWCSAGSEQWRNQMKAIHTKTHWSSGTKIWPN